MRKQVGLFQKFNNHSDNKKHKGLKKLTCGMDFDSCSERLADLSEFSIEYLKQNKKNETEKISNY